MNIISLPVIRLIIQHDSNSCRQCILKSPVGIFSDNVQLFQANEKSLRQKNGIRTNIENEKLMMIISPDLAFSMLTNHLLGPSPPCQLGCSWSRVSVEKKFNDQKHSHLSLMGSNFFHHPRYSPTTPKPGVPSNLSFHKQTNQLYRPGRHQPIWT